MLLKHNLTGLAVTDATITLVQVDEQAAVIAYSAYALPLNTVQQGRIINQAAFVAACQAARQEATPVPIDDPFAALRVSVSLPESQIWSHTEAIPKYVLQTEIESYVTERAATVLPVDLAAMTTDHVVTSTHGVTYATLAAADSAVIAEYTTALDQAGMKVERIGSGFYAAARAVLPPAFGADNFLIVDHEPSYTNVGVFDENAIAYMVIQNPAYSQSLPGLLEDVTELRALFRSATSQQITQIVVVGQHPDTVARAEALKGNFDVPVTLGDPLRHLQNPDQFEPVSSPTIFASAIGAALAGIDRTLPHIDLKLDKPGSVSVYLQSPLAKLQRLLNGSADQDGKPGAYTKPFNFIKGHSLLAVSVLCLAAIGILMLVVARYLLV